MMPKGNRNIQNNKDKSTIGFLEKVSTYSFLSVIISLTLTVCSHLSQKHAFGTIFRKAFSQRHLCPQTRMKSSFLPFLYAHKSHPRTQEGSGFQRLEISLTETSRGFESHPVRQTKTLGNIKFLRVFLFLCITGKTGQRWCSY